tara:strand:- start:1702 stop:2124 length:423 start_codon:yes stop_codon:yes gene_type:complete
METQQEYNKEIEAMAREALRIADKIRVPHNDTGEILDYADGLKILIAEQCEQVLENGDIRLNDLEDFSSSDHRYHDRLYIRGYWLNDYTDRSYHDNEVDGTTTHGLKMLHDDVSAVVAKMLMPHDCQCWNCEAQEALVNA